VPLHLVAACGELGRVLRRNLDELVEVTTGEEGLLGRGDDDAGDVFVLLGETLTVSASEERNTPSMVFAERPGASRVRVTMPASSRS